MTKKVLIIAGGLTHERDVSVRSGRRVANALTQAGYMVQVADLDRGLLDVITNFAPDVVWPLVHGSIGEDGSLQTLLEALRIPFVGSLATQAQFASNKPTAKALTASAGVDTPGWMALPQVLFQQLGADGVLKVVDSAISYPVVIKPANGGSALGISRATNIDELRSAMVDAFAYGEHIMVESFIEGRDLAVSVIDLGDGPIALPPVEIATDDGTYNYEARYMTDSTEYFVPARLTEDQLADVQSMAIVAHSLLGLRDLSRIDFVIDGNGTCWFIDANVAPGMTDTSLFPQAADAYGSFAEVCTQIVDFVADRQA